MSVSKKPMVLVILDGYGYREEQQDNAIFSAKTPVMDALWTFYKSTIFSCYISLWEFDHRHTECD